MSTARKCEFTESLRYAIANLDRIAKEDWQPTNDDVLHIRQRTTGIVETHFQVRPQDEIHCRSSTSQTGLKFGLLTTISPFDKLGFPYISDLLHFPIEFNSSI